jgi:hypothetical protein
VASLHAINSAKDAAAHATTSWNFAKAFEGWDNAFDKLLRGLEDKAAQVCACQNIMLARLTLYRNGNPV